MSNDNNDTPEREPCSVCETIVTIDGEQAIRRFGNVLCHECSNNPVAFKAVCDNGLCDWQHVVDGVEFNRGHLKTRAQQEANQHEDFKRVFNDNPCHNTTVRELTEYTDD